MAFVTTMKKILYRGKLTRLL